MRRFAHPWRAISFGIAALLIAGGAFGAGLLVRSPDAGVLEARDTQIAVFATVEMRSVSTDIRIQGETVGSGREDIFAQTPEGASSAVVTSHGVQAGAELKSGDLIAGVSDRPIFALITGVPLFRDLRMGDEGSDVRALQEALSLQGDGKVGGQTIRAVQRFYSSSGFEMPGGDAPYIKMSELRSIAPKQVFLETVAEVGTTLDADRSLATIASGQPYVQVRATVREADQIATGSAVTVQTASSETVAGEVSAISDFKEADVAGGRPPGRDVVVIFPEGEAPSPGEPVTALFGNSPPPQMAVPTIAVRSDAAGWYVMRESADGTERIDVRQVTQASGWTAVDSTGLAPGDRVLVSG